MILHPDLADQDIEEVAEELWTLGEQGLDRIEDLRATSEVAVLDARLAELKARFDAAKLERDRKAEPVPAMMLSTFPRKVFPG